MKVYIASSWKNQHAVEMLTGILREIGFIVLSFVEKSVSDEGRSNITFDFEKWINSMDGFDKFVFDTESARKSDLVIYIGPSGTDAWAEVGTAWSAGVPVLGLWSKGECAGLMRLMVEWFDNYRDLVSRARRIYDEKRKEMALP